MTGAQRARPVAFGKTPREATAFSAVFPEAEDASPLTGCGRACGSGHRPPTAGAGTAAAAVAAIAAAPEAQVSGGQARHGGQPRQPQRSQLPRAPSASRLLPRAKRTSAATAAASAPAGGAAATGAGTLELAAPPLERQSQFAPPPRSLGSAAAVGMKPKAAGSPRSPQSPLRSWCRGRLGGSTRATLPFHGSTVRRNDESTLLSGVTLQSPRSVDGSGVAGVQRVLSRVSEELTQGASAHQEALGVALCVMEDSVRSLYEHGPLATKLPATQKAAVLVKSRASPPRGRSGPSHAQGADGGAASGHSGELGFQRSGYTHLSRMNSRDSSWSSEGDIADSVRAAADAGVARGAGCPSRWLSAVLVDSAEQKRGIASNLGSLGSQDEQEDTQLQEGLPAESGGGLAASTMAEVPADEAAAAAAAPKAAEGDT